MANYTTQEQIELIFGTQNVKRWADLEGDANAETIGNRVTYACALSSAEMEDILRERRYQFPLTVSTTLSDLVAKMAGLHLHDARGVIDNENNPDTISRIRTEVDTKVRQIRAGEVYLPGGRNSNAPGVVNDPELHAAINAEPAAEFDPMKPFFGLRRI